MGAAIISIVGNATRDAEIKTIGQQQVAQFGVAVNIGSGDNATVNFFDVSVWGIRGAQHITKGAGLFVSGDFVKQVYKNAQGQEVTALRINCSTWSFTGPKRDAEPAPHDEPEEDIPF